MAVFPDTSAGNSPHPGGKAAHGTVLVLDDERLMRWTMRERLSQEGFTVLEAETGAEALALCRSRHVDLALLDLQLPDMDGIAVLDRMRAERNLCPAILMTAYGTPEIAEKAARSGASSCVAKPFDLEEMVARIEGELSHA